MGPPEMTSRTRWPAGWRGRRRCVSCRVPHLPRAISCRRSGRELAPPARRATLCSPGCHDNTKEPSGQYVRGICIVDQRSWLARGRQYGPILVVATRSLAPGHNGGSVRHCGPGRLRLPASPHDGAHLPTRSVKIGLGLFEVDVPSGKCVPQPRREALDPFVPWIRA
jgi:hypothetical protein